MSHPWFGFIFQSRLTGCYCILYCHNSVKNFRPIFRKFKDKLISISTCVVFQLFQDQEAMVSLKKQSFLYPTGKKRYMMPGAAIFSFNQARQFDRCLVTTSCPGLSINNPGAGGDVLHFDWLIKKQCAESKILESREIIIAKTNFEPSKWQKENQNQRNKLYSMSLKLCEPKNIWRKRVF